MDRNLVAIRRVGSRCKIRKLSSVGTYVVGGRYSWWVLGLSVSWARVAVLLSDSIVSHHFLCDIYGKCMFFFFFFTIGF